MINIFDYYTQASWDLHYSLLKAGYTHPTIVLNDDGFLPDDVTSPYRFFSGFEYGKGKPLYFNQVPVPDFWEIMGTGSEGSIHHYQDKKGTIHYASPAHKRHVRAVDWYDDKGCLRVTDRYNSNGQRFSQTTYNRDGQATITSYFNDKQQEYLTENHVTSDHLLNWQGKTYFFKSKIEWFHFYLKEAGFSLDCIFYNSLGLSFLTTYYLGGQGNDILFWSEPITDNIPGNMQLLLNSPSRQTKILVQSPDAYQRMQALLTEKQKGKVTLLGYNYFFKRQNTGNKQMLTLTNSDQVEQLETLLQAHPDWHFHVGAITEMSNRLMDLSKYHNLSLYPNISTTMVDKLYQTCDVYLDINHGNEILSAVRTAFNHNLVILGFMNTLHRPSYTAMKHRFDPSQLQQLSQQLVELANRPEAFSEALMRQYEIAGLAKEIDYKAKIQ